MVGISHSDEFFVRKRSLLGCLFALSILIAPTAASAQAWTDWTGSDPVLAPNNFVTAIGTVTGTLAGVTVTYTGGFVGAQLSGGTNYWNPDGAYTQNGLSAPNLNDFIQLNGATSGTISFSSAVLNPYFALISVGRTNLPVTYDFGSAAFTVVSNNNTDCAIWGCGSYTTLGNSLTGYEFSGTLQFTGLFNSITFSTDPEEYWHGFTVGAPVEAGTQSVVPEPATMSLLATGLIGMAAARKRRKTA